MIDSVTEHQLYQDLEEGDDSSFSKHFAAVNWDDRAEYGLDLKARLDGNRSSHPELPSLTLDITSYTDYLGKTHDYVASIKAEEERSWYNPLKYLSGERTKPYEIYSPTVRESIDHSVDKLLKLPPT